MLRFVRLCLPATVGILMSAGIVAADIAAAQARPQSRRSPVLVELFTSEGCSTCPPADVLLAKLVHDQPVKGREIIALGEHVDYWDQLGWHDRFSSHQYTERQNRYSARFNLNDVYTPQMVVDGTEQFVGNDAAHALRAVTRSGHTAKIDLRLSAPLLDGRRISFTVSSPAPSGTLPEADLYAALIDPA